MEILNDYKDLLSLGMKLEMCGDWDSAADVYFACVKKEARLSVGGDVLEYLYGYSVYDEPIQTYAKAVEYLFIAACAKRLVEIIEGKFPEAGCFQTPSGTEKSDDALIDFFNWLTKPRKVQTADYIKLKKAKDSLEKRDKILVEVSTAVARRTLATVVLDLVNGNTRVIGKKLQ